jgi:hypothetical protein
MGDSFAPVSAMVGVFLIREFVKPQFLWYNKPSQGGIAMRKNFGAKPWTYPQPVFILATYNENGTPDAMNAAWAASARTRS